MIIGSLLQGQKSEVWNGLKEMLPRLPHDAFPNVNSLTGESLRAGAHTSDKPDLPPCVDSPASSFPRQEKKQVKSLQLSFMDEESLLLIKRYLAEQGYFGYNQAKYETKQTVIYQVCNPHNPQLGSFSCKFVLYQDSESATSEVERVNLLYKKLNSLPNVLPLITCRYLCFPKQNKYMLYQVSEWMIHDMSLELTERLALQNYWKEREVLEHLKQLVELLKAAQMMHICHLDIKPQNIFFDKFDRIVLGDFGLSQQLDCDQTDDLTLMVSGTPGFMEPPLRQAYIQRQPQLHRNPYKGDVYSLGLTFRETVKCISDYSPKCRLAKLLDCMSDNNSQRRPDFLQLAELISSDVLSRPLFHDPTKIYRCVHILKRTVSEELTLICGHKLCEQCVRMQGTVYTCLVCPQQTLCTCVTRKSLLPNLS